MRAAPSPSPGSSVTTVLAASMVTPDGPTARASPASNSMGSPTVTDVSSSAPPRPARPSTDPPPASSKVAVPSVTSTRSPGWRMAPSDRVTRLPPASMANGGALELEPGAGDGHVALVVDHGGDAGDEHDDRPPSMRATAIDDGSVRADLEPASGTEVGTFSGPGAVGRVDGQHDASPCVPWPSTDSSSIEDPPWARAMRPTSARPRPRPPKGRVTDPSSWVKSPMTSSMRSAGMPAPRSVTARRTTWVPIGRLDRRREVDPSSIRRIFDTVVDQLVERLIDRLAVEPHLGHAPGHPADDGVTGWVEPLATSG